ncbi:expressed unknown protein [Seminavis robusta]|uniref:Uncharacterized protein n=1 Tax=Seminavis robusta TaxID=568900 RepID=A0A9N8F0M7_9STRA|nr:expressed unknown protein [Seminavis robusta]|eukprot:Sro2171_g317480.1 n/a (612) ;mRNA; f:10268-12103
MQTTAKAIYFFLRKRKLQFQVQWMLDNQWFPVALLNEFPSLILKQYDIGLAHGTPLHWLLMEGRAELLQQLEFVKALCDGRSDLKQLLRTRDAHGRAPIHVACQYCPMHVIEYLIELDPETLSIRTTMGRGCLPYELAMANTRYPIPMEKLKRMLEKHPDTRNFGKMLCYAYLTNQPMELLEFIADLFLTKQINQQDLHVCNRCWDIPQAQARQSAFTLDQAKLITKILTNVKRLALALPSGWESDAFIYIMRYLQNNQCKARLEKISLPILSSIESDQERRRVVDAFQGFLQSNCRVGFLVILTEEYSVASSREAWYEAIVKGLGNRKFSDPLTLSIQTARENHRIPRANLTAKYSERRRCVYHVDLDVDRRDRPFLLHQLSLLPKTIRNLENLTLRCTRANDDVEEEIDTELSSHIAQFLASTPTLKVLRLEEVFIDPLPIFQAIRTHQSLESFEVSSFSEELSAVLIRDDIVSDCLDLLQKNNTSLEECSPWCEYNEQIKYLLALNRRGIARVRNASDACTVMEAAALGLYTGAFEQSISYDLLRERPDLWCRVALQSPKASTLVKMHPKPQSDIGRVGNTLQPKGGPEGFHDESIVVGCTCRPGFGC